MSRVDRPLLVGSLATLLVLGGAGLVLSSYWIYLAITAAVIALVARSVGLVTSEAGMISLCQLTFASVGGWTVMWLNTYASSVPFVAAVALIWTTVCQAPSTESPRWGRALVSVKGAAGRPGCATRGQADMRGSGWPQDRVSS